MLQASSQYLRPEYMAVPSATMDTKSSPLALLAQTCSAIGADTTNPKLLAANIEKSTKSLKSNSSIDGRDKSSPVSSHSSSVSTGSVEHQQIHSKATFKPYESNNNHMRDRHDIDTTSPTNLTNNSQSNSHKVKTPKNNGQLPYSTQQRCDSNQSASSQRDSPAVTLTNGNSSTNALRKTPTGMAMDLQQRFSSSPQRTSSKESAAMNASAASQLSPTSSLRAPPTSTSAPTPTEASFAVAMAKEASYMKALHAAAAAAASAGANSGSVQGNAAYYPSYSSSTAGMSYPMDLMTASALMSPHHPMFKAAALNPYLNYARLKGLQDPAAAAAAAAMMTPNICRDPYCTGCPASPHFINKASGQPCPAGCPQCDGGSGSNSNKSNGPNSSAAAAASSYHAQLAALAAASQMPYVCSWIGGDTPYCGKRFGTSDELFQHLRTHTASMPESVLTAAAAGGIPPNHPLFQRTYPTPPLSPLSAARYHPYGKPSMLPPSLAPPGSLAGLPMPPHPALAQYFSPYALYGPRMGSSHP